jgi:hypothetical protein
VPEELPVCDRETGILPFLALGIAGNKMSSFSKRFSVKVDVDTLILVNAQTVIVSTDGRIPQTETALFLPL